MVLSGALLQPSVARAAGTAAPIPLDPEVIELTFTVSLFNYFTRMVEGLGLAVERWVLDGKCETGTTAAC
jgi:hypothetical protein